MCSGVEVNVQGDHLSGIPATVREFEGVREISAKNLSGKMFYCNLVFGVTPVFNRLLGDLCHLSVNLLLIKSFRTCF